MFIFCWCMGNVDLLLSAGNYFKAIQGKNWYVVCANTVINTKILYVND